MSEVPDTVRRNRLNGAREKAAMVNWRIEGIDEQGRTRFVEYERGDYRADPRGGE